MKKVKSYYGYGIYQLTEKEIAKQIKENTYYSDFKVYLPEETPAMLAIPEFECDSLQECIDNIGDFATRKERKAYLGL